MRKLLSLIGTLGIISSTSTMIVACKPQFKRFSDPAINAEIKKWIIAQINSENSSAGINYSFNDIFTKADLKTLAVRLLDTNISKYFYSSEEATRARYTGTTIDVSQPDSDIAKQVVKFVEQVATDKLYTEYLTGIANNNPLELTISSSGYSPDYQSDTWYVGGVQSYFWSGAGNPNYKQTRVEQNQAVNFTLKSNAAGSDYTDFNVANEENKKEYLKVRFKDYYTHVKVPSVIDTILTATYLHQNQIKRFGIDTTSKIYLNKNSALFNAVQSWDTVAGSSWNSYIKMAWELKLDTQALTNFFGTGQVFEDPIDVNKKILTTNDGEATLTAIKTAFNTATAGQQFNNMATDGIDPIFGISGFKGFIGLDKSKNEIFTTINNADAYKQKIIDTQKPGLIKSSEGESILSYQFLDTNKKYGSVVIVLPIYTIDLMKNMNINYESNATNNKQLDLTWYGSSSQPINLDEQWLFQQGPASARSLQWLYNKIGFLGTHDNNGTALYDTAGNSIVANQKGQILKWIEYTFAQNANLQKAAKSRLYSVAFGYNPKNVYSQSLYDTIGTYITKDDDDD